jgi:oxygen-independent coproporphyrinogen III oxidase
MSRISPRTLPQALLDRYQTSGPRYTSYPTAPQFQADFDRAEVLSRFKQSNRGDAGLSFYLHLPFCKSRCRYCGCYTLLGYEEAGRKKYVDAVLDQADWVLKSLDGKRPVEQLAMGGGTPTSLAPETMRHLVEGLQQRFSFSPTREQAIEVDPRWVDSAYLDLLLELGFNRVSFGLQDLNCSVQENINRVLPFETIEGHMKHLRERGLEAINLDLIYGLPGQTPETFARTIEQVISLRPSRIATFGYAHVPWVSPHQKELEPFGLPSTEERMELFGLAYELLLDAGWRHVGMDHFALPTDELVLALDDRTLTRNFMGYTTRHGLDLVGLGASAIGSVNGTYVQNEKVVPTFEAGVGVDRWVRGYVMDDEDCLRRDVIMALFCNFHLDIGFIERTHGIVFKEHFAWELEQLQPMRDDGLLSWDEKEILVSNMGHFFVRNIAMFFDAYLRKEGTREGRYSKTL